MKGRSEKVGAKRSKKEKGIAACTMMCRATGRREAIDSTSAAAAAGSPPLQCYLFLGRKQLTARTKLHTTTWPEKFARTQIHTHPHTQSLRGENAEPPRFARKQKLWVITSSFPLFRCDVILEAAKRGFRSRETTSLLRGDRHAFGTEYRRERQSAVRGCNTRSS